MKNLFTVIVFAISVSINAQEKRKIPFFSLDPFYEIDLDMRDGTKIFGFGRTSFADEIIFKTDDKAEKVTYNSKQVKTITMKKNDKIYVYEYKIDKNSSTIKLVELILMGKMNLYSTTNCDRYGNCYPTYYISKSNENFIQNMGGGRTRSNSFQEKAAEIFADCPALIEKIKAKYFRKYGVEDVVNYYNSSCAN